MNPDETEEGTRASSLVQCGCGALLSLDTAISTKTPGVTLTAVVIATMPCSECGKTSRTLVRFDKEQS